MFAELIAERNPPWTRRARWEEVVKIDKVNETTVAISRRGGLPIRIFTAMIESGWDADSIIGLIDRYRPR